MLLRPPERRAAPGKDRSEMKGDEQQGRASVHARGESLSKERTKIRSETERSARVHRHSYIRITTGYPALFGTST
jgi:hypothetical protein